MTALKPRAVLVPPALRYTDPSALSPASLVPEAWLSRYKQHLAYDPIVGTLRLDIMKTWLSPGPGTG